MRYFFNQQCIAMYVGTYGLHYNVLMMPVLQDVGGLTKELYIIVISRRKTSFHAQFSGSMFKRLPVWLPL